MRQYKILKAVGFPFLSAAFGAFTLLAGIVGLKQAAANGGSSHQATTRSVPSPQGYGYTNGSFRVSASRQISGRTGPLVFDGQVTVTALHSGQKLRITMNDSALHIGQETGRQPYLLPLASMPFDTNSETVSFHAGLTTFRDKTGRSLTVTNYSAR